MSILRQRAWLNWSMPVAQFQGPKKLDLIVKLRGGMQELKKNSEAFG
jgi:hypothetical protein